MQTMLRMIGFGDNAGSGVPAIISAWENEGWIKPELKEDTRLNQITLTLSMMPGWQAALQKLYEKIIENMEGTESQVQEMSEFFIYLRGTIPISIEKHEFTDRVIKRVAAYIEKLEKERKIRL